MIYLSLFFEFFKAGLFAVGGGLATIPFMKEISLRTGWFTLSQLTDMIAVSESTPGPMGVNCATYVGYETAGILGGIIATLGLIAPSIIVIIIISKILEKFRNNKYVDAAFFGLRAASVALIADAGVSVAELTFVQSGSTILEMINWQSIVLKAGNEVSNALVKYNAYAEQSRLAEKQVELYRKSLKDTKMLYTSSGSSYLEVISAQRDLLNAEISKVTSDFSKMQAVVSLYTALGGGTK